MSDTRPLTGPLSDLVRQLRRPVSVGQGDELDPRAVELARREGQERMRRVQWAASVPQRFVDAEPPDFAGEVGAALAEWSNSDHPPNLLVVGPTGTGKSHAAVAAIRRAFFAGRDVGFWPVAELCDWLRPGPDDRERMGDLMDLDRLVIDDVGAERSTEWTVERLDIVVNRRWLEERPTVVTSNLEPTALEGHIGEHCYSRLVGSGAVALRLTGADRRRSK